MKKHIGGTLLALAMILALLTACGGGKSANGNSASSAPAATDTAAEGPSGAPEAPMDPEQGEYGYYQESASLDQGGNNALRDAKIIRTANLEMETTAFDGAVESLSRLTKEMGGYYENSSLRTGGSGYRWADYTVRVPAERYDEFLLRAGELCNLTSPAPCAAMTPWWTSPLSPSTSGRSTSSPAWRRSRTALPPGSAPPSPPA